MKKRNYCRFFCAICMAVLLIGCENVTEKDKSEEPKFADTLFVEDMAEGLQERWKLNEEDKKKDGYSDLPDNSEEKKEMMVKYIETELDHIEKYKDEKFEDSNLQELMIKYINLLKQHQEICSYMTVDYDKYYEEFEKIYDERSHILETLVNDYGLKVNEEYQNILNDFLTNSKLVTEESEKVDLINKMVGKIEFKCVSDDNEDFKTYQATVENITGSDLKTFSIDINLLDKEGVIIGTEYVYVDNFKNGSKARLEFMTDKNFETTEITANWWE